MLSLSFTQKNEKCHYKLILAEFEVFTKMCSLKENFFENRLIFQLHPSIHLLPLIRSPGLAVALLT